MSSPAPAVGSGLVVMPPRVPQSWLFISRPRKLAPDAGSLGAIFGSPGMGGHRHPLACHHYPDVANQEPATALAPHYLELTELSRRIHARDLSPVEATKAQLGRIEKLDGQLKSYAHIMAEAGLLQARAAEAEIMRGEIRGPLHGVPIAVKDLCWTQGVPMAACTTIYKDFRPTEDATVVRKLYAAGAIILGKLQLTEGAWAEHHPQIPPPVNPWNAAHWSGASSSGSGVATAAGLCYGSLGSDTSGSIRFPCAANGVTGIKPTWGRVSRYGVFELAATLDRIGPMARSAADCGAMLGVIAGSDPNDPTASLEPCQITLLV